MADPATILAIINGSLGLALKIGSVVNKLYSLSKNFKSAELDIQSIASECQTIQTAWIAIESWARTQPYQSLDEQQPLLDRLRESLLFGTMVLSALEADLEPFTAEPQNFSLFKKGKVVWNDASLASHRDRIRGQVAAMTLLLQVINLPSSNQRTDLLERERQALRNSDETAWTIVDSRASFSSRPLASQSSLGSSSETIYVKFDFEPELLSGKVYARHYNSLAQNAIKANRQSRVRDARAELFIPGETSGDDGRTSALTLSRFPMTTTSEGHSFAKEGLIATPPDRGMSNADDNLASGPQAPGRTSLGKAKAPVSSIDRRNPAINLQEEMRRSLEGRGGRRRNRSPPQIIPPQQRSSTLRLPPEATSRRKVNSSPRRGIVPPQRSSVIELQRETGTVPSPQSKSVVLSSQESNFHDQHHENSSPELELAWQQIISQSELADSCLNDHREKWLRSHMRDYYSHSEDENSADSIEHLFRRNVGIGSVYAAQSTRELSSIKGQHLRRSRSLGETRTHAGPSEVSQVVGPSSGTS